MNNIISINEGGRFFSLSFMKTEYQESEHKYFLRICFLNKVFIRYFGVNKFLVDINKSRDRLVAKIKRCKEQLNNYSDVPISWQLDVLCTIWEGKECIGSNGRPQVMHKDFAIQLQLLKNSDDAILKFARSLPEWNDLCN